jgi:hypothetical protein
MATKQTRDSTHIVGWTLQSLAMMAVALFGLFLMTESGMPFTPGLLTMAGLIGISGTVLIGR